METPTPQWWFNGIVGAFVSLMAAVFEYYRRKVDRIHEKYVSKEALQQYLTEMREDRQRMHAENLDVQKEIRVSIERVHTRIDQVFKA